MISFPKELIKLISFIAIIAPPQNCFSYYNIFDLNGNVGEWTTRRDGGSTNFHGSIKGGYWFQPRTIQSSITSHGDAYRGYYLGFRCAKDEIPTLSKSIENNELYVKFLIK